MLYEGLDAAGSSFKDVFVSNVVHCHPPGNRASKKQEIQNCKMFLLEEIDMCEPGLVVAIGANARDCFHLKGNRPGALVRYSFERFMFDVAWVYHPSYIMRAGNPALKERWLETWRKLLRR